MNKERTQMATDRATMLRKIQSLAFVKAELELYLDTHPSCRVALDYYYKTLDALRESTALYESLYGPLTAAGNVNPDEWQWVSSPWPWHRDDEKMSDRWRGV